MRQAGRALAGALITATAAAAPAAAADPLDTSALEGAGAQVPQASVPEVPQVDVSPQPPPTPSVPSIPSVPSPSLPPAPTVPSLPSTPSLPPAPAVPSVPSVPSVPVVPSSSPTTAAPPPSTELGTASGADPDAGSSGPKGETAGSGHHTPSPAARRARRFERTVRELRGCLAALPALQWRLAVLRAGIYTGEPISRSDVARRLDVSRKRVRRLERSALRTLRESARSGSCDEGTAATAPASLGGAVPPLALSGSLGETTVTAPASGAGGRSADGGGDSASGGGGGVSGAVAGFFEQASGPAGIGASLVLSPAETLPLVTLALALLLLIAAAAYVYRRRPALIAPSPVRFERLRSTVALPGDVMPFIGGSELRVTEPPLEANGDVLEMEMFLPPSTESPPKHVHPAQREDYEVLEGTLELFVHGEWHTVEAGELASVPKGEVHTFRVGDEPVRVSSVLAPGLDFEDYFATESALTRAGKIKGYSSLRSILHYAVLLSEYRHCTVVADHRLGLLLGALAPVGRLLGFGRP